MSHATLIAEIEDWLIGKALSDADIATLFEKLCQRLNAIGMPMARGSLSWPTLHPLFRSEQVFWRLGEGTDLQQYIHSTAQNDVWIKSPLYHVMLSDLPHFRRQLAGPGALLDFDVLVEFRDQGYTDYLVTATTFRIAEIDAFEGGRSGIVASWATKRQGGFSDDDLEALKRIQMLLAVACRAVIQKRVMSNLANAYLGQTAGWQVLAGDIRRGDGDRISAIVWFSDLRGSTRLSDRMDADSYLALLNRYFECTAQPVIDNGGEVLNFIGDGVLAIFPVEGKCPHETAARAEEAVRGAIDGCLPLRQCDPAFEFGIGLAVGEIMFGNIGVPGRLAFSAIGRVVNQVHRVEAATKRLGQPVLATGDFVALAGDGWRPAGDLDSPDFEGPIPLFAPADVADMSAETGHAAE